MNGTKAGLWHDLPQALGAILLTCGQSSPGSTARRNFLRCCRYSNTPWLWVLIRGLISHHYLSHRGKAESSKTDCQMGYTDAHGNIIASVYRYDSDGRKEFRPWDAVRGAMRAPDIRPLYNQVGLKDAALVVLAEGEKCAQALITQGICATTAMNGAKAPVNKTDCLRSMEKTPSGRIMTSQAGDARRAARAAARASGAG